MKKGKRKKRGRSQAQEAFVRGFVATALLTLDRLEGSLGGLAGSNIPRALKGGIAIASGTLVAEALQNRKYSRSLVALAVGAAGMAVVGRYLTPHGLAKGDQIRGQKEQIQQVEG